MAHLPIVTGATHTALAPIEAPSRTVTPTGSQSWPDFSDPSGFTERGKWSLVKTAAGPMNAPSSTLRRFVDQGVVLDLDVVADLDTGADVGTAPDDAVLAEDDAFTHLREVPDRRIRCR